MYQIKVKPRTTAAAIKLREKFRTLDELFQKLHANSRIDKKEHLEHGLKLWDFSDEQSLCVYVSGHEDYYHLKQTKKDLKKAMKEVLGSLREYKIKKYW